MNSGVSSLGKIAALLLITLLFSGCASTSNNPEDPYEGYNRAMFTFNEKVDKVALKPVAKVYKKVTPSFVQAGIGNFFGNISDVWIGANNLMQGKGGDGANDFARVMINSTLGVFGVFDIASEAGIPKHNEDFGQTLGKWGVGSGPYIVLPFFGPSTARDTVALPLDLYTDPWGQVYPVRYRNAGIAVRVIHKRATLLDAEKLVKGAALDRYQFMRDAYLQRRQSLINDNGTTADLPQYEEESSDEAPKETPASSTGQSTPNGKTGNP